MRRELEAVLFDKDGTLLDFHATWDPAVREALHATASSPAAVEAAAAAIGFDLETSAFRDDSIFVAEPNDVILSALAPHLDADRFSAALDELGSAMAVPAPGATRLLDELRNRGIATAIVTNDWEWIARNQLDHLGWRDRFDVVLGSDSGHGAKPDPGMVHGALTALGATADAAAMIGDSSHDLLAAGAAGVEAVLVTNGAADPKLTTLADRVISTLADFLPA